MTVSSLRTFGVARIAVAVAGLVGTWLAFALAVAGVTGSRNPAVALKFAPHDSIALAARADELLLANPLDPPEAVGRLALASLRQQSLNPRALRILGYYAAAKGQTSRADAYIRLAERQSRREMAVQLWLIEDAVRKGDVTGALAGYDIVFRTQPGTYTTLFPILMSAIDDRAIRVALGPYLRHDHGWQDAFLTHAIANSSNLPALVDLIIERGGLGSEKAAIEHTAALMRRLIDEQRFADARRLYLHLPGARAARLIDIGLDDADRSGRFGAIGWQVKTNPDSGASFVEQDSGRTGLNVYANAATTAVVANKPLFLSPGDYAFAARLAITPGDGGGLVRWQLRCPTRNDGRLIWTLDGVAAAPRGLVTIPAGCPVQFLDVVASSDRAQPGLDATILDATLRPRR